MNKSTRVGPCQFLRAGVYFSRVMTMADVLLCNIRNREKLKKLRFILLKLGIRGEAVNPEQAGLCPGALLGMPDYSQAEASPLPGDYEPREMLVMHELSSLQFSSLLSALRQERVPIALKAVVTQTNAAWPLYRLQRELAAEHEAMSRYGQSTH